MNSIRVGLIFILCCFASALSAQQAVIERGNTQVGTIQTLDQDVGLIEISGRQYGYSDEVLNVFYDGDVVDSIILEPGMVIRFRVNTDQVVTQIELLGPTDKIRAFFEH